MQYLIPQVLASDIIDRYEIWVNTTDKEDIFFFEEIAKRYQKITLVWQPNGIVNGIESINAFYKQCVDSNTIYFKLDDDIVWMEPGSIESMVAFRVDNPQYFIVSPLVINNALCTYILQTEGLLRLPRYIGASASSPVLWKSGKFAYDLHTWFLDSILKRMRYAELHCGAHEFGLTRFSINAILWFGAEMKEFYGEVPGDDEEFLSCIYPTKARKSNCINGDVVFSHFAFYPQRAKLDSRKILEQYGDFLLETWITSNGVERKVYDDICGIMKYIKENEEGIRCQPNRYERVRHKLSIVRRISTTMKMLLPYGLVNMVANRKIDKVDWIL